MAGGVSGGGGGCAWQGGHDDRGPVWQVGEHAWLGGCVAGGGMCSRGGMCGRGACMAGRVHGGGVHGRGACVGCTSPWQILQDTVNEWTVCLLLECILVFRYCTLLIYLCFTLLAIIGKQV